MLNLHAACTPCAQPFRSQQANLVVAGAAHTRQAGAIGDSPRHRGGMAPGTPGTRPGRHACRPAPRSPVCCQDRWLLFASAQRSCRLQFAERSACDVAEPIAAAFPIEQIRDAVALQAGRHVHGKIVITL